MAKTNAQLIKEMVAMHEAYANENDGLELLTPKTYETLKELCDTYKDDDVLNLKFNKALKPLE